MKVKTILTLALAATTLAACHRGKKPPRMDNSKLAISLSKPAKGDRAIYGLACLGCSDTALVLLPNGGGDPVRYNILDATRNHQVFGDIEVGDWVCVMPCEEKDEKNRADMVIDLDQLKATWTYPVMPKLRDVSHLSKRQQARILANMPDSIVETYMVPRQYGFTLKRMSEVKVEKAEKTDDGFVCRKDDFGDDGLAVTLIPEDGGNPVVLRLQIPYIGFSLYDAEGNKVHGELSIPQDKVDDYTYEFVGDDNNDRFTLQLDSNRLVYMCVLRHEDHQLVVRNQRDRLSVVDQIPTEGKLSELLMNTNSALIKNRNHRWRIQIEGTTLSHEVELNVDAASLVAFAEEQMQKGMEIDELGQHLMALEQKYHFQWFWLSEDDWSHDNPVFDMFMKQLCAFSYVSQNPVQADALMARNYKRKIRRYSSMLKAHKRGELNLFKESDEVRAEYLRIFQGFHQPFVEAFEKEEEE